MSVLATTHPTLLDIKNRLDPNGQVAQVIEMLNQTNEILDDAVWIEANELTGHTTSVRTGIPEPTWRKLYGGVQPTKTTSVKVREGLGMLENYAEVDKALADLNGNSAAWRMSEESGIIEGFGQKLARYMVYGNEATEPEGFTGLAPRFNSKSAVNGGNILTSASTPDATDNTSLWVVGWGPQTVHMIYPKGSQAGLQISDKGQVTIEDVDGNGGGRMEAYRTHYKWDAGMAVRDWRYVVRINFDLEDIVADGKTGPVLRDMLAKAMRRIPNLNVVRPAIYMNRDALDAFDLQMNRDPLLQFRTQETAQGKFVTTFRGVPIRRVDQILSTEAGVA
ncbi:major capsid protein [Castellaniella sp. FW104-16D08]|uniref:major capsid protein n=1 Tax=unclassified Castellaniella TaxID=2617606 RepID=UPI003315F487